MKQVKMVLYIGLLVGLVCSISAQVSETPSPAPVIAVPQPEFGMSFDLGYVPLFSQRNAQMESWQHIGLKPELRIGDWGFGLGIDFNFRFNGGTDSASFELRSEDWVVDDFAGFLETYLPKIRYVSYAKKGAPLYLSFGDINDGRLGNGFIVNGYDNTLFQPGQRIFGMSFDLDGKVFDFPWAGMETMVGNFAAWDLLAMRLYTRPAASSGVAMLEAMQIGLTLAIDTNPYYYSPVPGAKENLGQKYAGIWGIDFLTPLVSIDPFKLNLIGDLALQNLHFGAQLGVAGTIINIFTYTALLRFNSPDFIPEYFDKLYDINREARLAAYTATGGTSDPYAGWLASLGFNLLDGAISLNLTMDGPITKDTTIAFPYPELKAVFGLKPGILAGLSFEAYYYKSNIATFSSLFDGYDAVIGARLSYAMGPAVLSIVYDLTYDPYALSKGMDKAWTVNSRIETSIVLIGPGGAK